MNKTLRRLLALLLAGCMICMSTSAIFAAEENAAPAEAAAENVTAEDPASEEIPDAPAVSSEENAPASGEADPADAADEDAADPEDADIPAAQDDGLPDEPADAAGDAQEAAEDAEEEDLLETQSDPEPVSDPVYIRARDFFSPEHTVVYFDTADTESELTSFLGTAGMLSDTDHKTRIVFVSANTYTFSYGFTIPAGVVLAAAEGTVFKYTSNGNAFVTLEGNIVGGTWDGGWVRPEDEGAGDAGSHVTNIIYNNGTAFMYDGWILDAKITGSGKNGICAINGSKYMQILGCEITGNKENGIAVEQGAQVQWISKCVITNNGYDDDPTHQDNAKKNGSGINISHSDVGEIEDCTISGNYDKAISTNTDRDGMPQNTCTIGTVYGNLMENNKVNGVYLKPLCTIEEFRYNLLKDNTDGISLQSISNNGLNTGEVTIDEFEDNIFIGNEKNQIYLNGPEASLVIGDNNVVVSGKSNGIYANNGACVAIDGDGNQINGNAGAGISAANSSALIIAGTGTNVNSNTGNGIYAVGSVVSISGPSTSILENQQSGINLNNSTIYMSGTGSLILDNANDGIYAKGTSDGNVQNTIIARNGKHAVYNASPAAVNVATVAASKITASPIVNKRYTGKALTQNATMTFQGIKLKQGLDYKVSYKNNTKVGTATMVITGTGGFFTGSVNKTFKIVSAPSWTRLAGASGTGALGTMEQITKKFGSSSSYAIVVTNGDFKDALAAAALAGAYNAPVLTTAKGSLSAQTKSELVRMKVKNVIIVGSTSDVSTNTENQIRAIAADMSVERISGSSASDKAVKSALRIPLTKECDTVIIATQKSFKDAMSISSYAYASVAPILYVESNLKLSMNSLDCIQELSFTKAIIVGGPIAIPTDVETQLAGIGISAANITRLAGKGCYGTSAAIAEWAVGKIANGKSYAAGNNYQYTNVKFQPAVTMSANMMGISRGDGWKDALCGAALCGKNRSVILLADGTNSAMAISVVKKYKSQISGGYVFGGTQAVPAAVMTKIVNASK